MSGPDTGHGLTIARGSLDAVALIDAETGITLTHADLDTRTATAPADWPRAKSLVFVFCDNTLDCVLTYLTALRHGHAVALLDSDLTPEFADQLLASYSPAVVWRGGRTIASTTDQASVHTDLAVLLTTSGSTGSPKFVRLSAENIDSNTEAIIDSLGITAADRAITTLPLHYSYGMTVLNTHLRAGASVVLSRRSAVEPEFWSELSDFEVTSLAGVPFSYQMFLRTGLAKRELPTLRHLTQAGGAMNPRLARQLLDLSVAKGWTLHVMYGQTEAAPRIACVPAERLTEKLGSAGVVLSGGTLEVITDDGPTTAPNVTGEIRYTGPNVMMGYAESAADLSRGDEHGRSLLTGDLGHLDDEGFLWISGRSKRFAKVVGLRINLDEVERLITATPAAAIEHREAIHVFHPPLDEAVAADARSDLAGTLKLPPASVRFHSVDEIPTLGNDKTDYAALRSILEGEQ